MAEISRDELRQVRIEVAIRTCMNFPDLAMKLIDNKPQLIKKNEEFAYKVLKKLMRVEPCIKHILKFYVKREAR
jgi:hypothetical protein